MPGGGDFVSFFPLRGRSFAQLSPGRGFSRKKLSGLGVSPGGW